MDRTAGIVSRRGRPAETCSSSGTCRPSSLAYAAPRWRDDARLPRWIVRPRPSSRLSEFTIGGRTARPLGVPPSAARRGGPPESAARSSPSPETESWTSDGPVHTMPRGRTANAEPEGARRPPSSFTATPQHQSALPRAHAARQRRDPRTASSPVITLAPKAIAAPTVHGKGATRSDDFGSRGEPPICLPDLGERRRTSRQRAAVMVRRLAEIAGPGKTPTCARSGRRAGDDFEGRASHGGPSCPRRADLGGPARALRGRDAPVSQRRAFAMHLGDASFVPRHRLANFDGGFVRRGLADRGDRFSAIHVWRVRASVVRRIRISMCIRVAMARSLSAPPKHVAQSRPVARPASSEVHGQKGRCEVCIGAD
jgi:hypothetical protein